MLGVKLPVMWCGTLEIRAAHADVDVMTTDVIARDLDSEIALIAVRYRKAGGVGLQVLNLLGGQAEGLLDRLPDPVKLRLSEATERALHVALGAAQKSRSVVPDQAGWLNTAAATAMGAAGGFGGLPSALAELPITTTVLLRAIQGVAAEYGYDPAEPEILSECLHVFSSAGPLAHDDGADTGFLSARMTLTGPADCTQVERGAWSKAGGPSGACDWCGCWCCDELRLHQLLSGNGACAFCAQACRGCAWHCPGATGAAIVRGYGPAVTQRAPMRRAIC
jgi:hypothetical protein